MDPLVLVFPVNGLPPFGLDGIQQFLVLNKIVLIHIFVIKLLSLQLELLQKLVLHSSKLGLRIVHPSLYKSKF